MYTVGHNLQGGSGEPDPPNTQRASCSFFPTKWIRPIGWGSTTNRPNPVSAPQTQKCHATKTYRTRPMFGILCTGSIVTDRHCHVTVSWTKRTHKRSTYILTTPANVNAGHGDWECVITDKIGHRIQLCQHLSASIKNGKTHPKLEDYDYPGAFVALSCLLAD